MKRFSAFLLCLFSTHALAASTNTPVDAYTLDGNGNAITSTGNALDVNINGGTVSIDTTGLATSAKQDTGNTSLGSIDLKLSTLGSPFQAGGSIGNASFGISGSLPAFGSTPTFNLGTLNGAATAAKQDSIISALGSPFQAGGSIGNSSFGISGSLPAFASTPTFNLGTLNGAALDSSLATINATLTAINATLGSPLQAGGSVAVSNFPASQTIAGSVTANAGTNLNTSALGLEATQSAFKTANHTDLGAINTTLGSPFQAGGSIGNSSFGISGTLPAYAATPTFNLGTIGTAATAANQATMITSLGTINTTLGSPFQAGGSIGNSSFGISGTLPSYAATPTFNLGTIGTAASDASVTGLEVAQNSTTSGQNGPLVQGAVTTSAPSYTTAKTSPLSLTTGGLLRVDNSAVTTALGSPFQAGGSIGNTAFGISGTLPAFASTPTFNLGTLNGVALDSSITTTNSRLSTINTTLGSPFQAGGSIGNSSFGISGTLPAYAATPTFNLGTLNGAATDSSVTGLQVAQGSTTSGESGPLAQTATTTSAPTYTTAKTNPLSTDTSGNLRTVLSAETTKVIGTVNMASGQTIGLAAGSQVVGHVINDASSAVIGHVIADSGSTTAVTGTVATSQADTTTTGTFNANAQNVTVAVAGYNSASFFTTGTFVGTIQAYFSQDGGTTWTNNYFFDALGNNNLYGSTSLSAGALQTSIIVPPGATHIKVATTAFTSGSSSVKLNATSVTGQPIELMDNAGHLAVITAASTATAASSPSLAVGISPNGLNPCQNPSATLVSITGATSTTNATQIIALSGSLKIYVCSVTVIGVSGTSPTFSLVQGTGSNCVTGQTTVMQSWATTAGTLYQFATPVAVGAAGAELCYKDGGTSPVQNYQITYVQQ